MYVVLAIHVWGCAGTQEKRDMQARVAGCRTQLAWTMHGDSRFWPRENKSERERKQDT